MEKYLLEKSRLVYQEHNERWVRHRKQRQDFMDDKLYEFCFIKADEEFLICPPGKILSRLSPVC